MKFAVFVLAAVLSSGAVAVKAQEGVFEEVLNGCLASAGASLVECARIASAEAGSQDLEVHHKIRMIDGEPDSTSGRVLGNCNTTIGFPKIKTCDVYSCNEDYERLQSVCTLVGKCSSMSVDPQKLC